MLCLHSRIPRFSLPVAVVLLLTISCFAGFEVKDSYPVPMPVSIGVGDFDGDGVADLAIAEGHPNDAVAIFYGNGDGSFRPGPIYQAGGNAVTVADLNLDGKPDLITADGAFEVSVLLNKGDGTFQPPMAVGFGTQPNAVAVGDLNEDGVPDLVVAVGGYGPPCGVAVLLGNGDGSFQTRKWYGVGRWPYDIVLADFNRDGHLDVATANRAGRTVTLRLGNGDGTLQERRNIQLFGIEHYADQLAAADFNADGIPDLAVVLERGYYGPPGKVVILTGIGDGTFSLVTHGFPEDVLSVRAGDLNNDGLPDLVVGNTLGAAAIFNLGNGNFRSGGNQGTPDILTRVAVADLNGDGLPDIVQTSYSQNQVVIILNTGGR